METAFANGFFREKKQCENTETNIYNTDLNYRPKVARLLASAPPVLVSQVNFDDYDAEPLSMIGVTLKSWGLNDGTLENYFSILEYRLVSIDARSSADPLFNVRPLYYTIQIEHKDKNGKTTDVHYIENNGYGCRTNTTRQHEWPIPKNIFFSSTGTVSLRVLPFQYYVC